MKTIHIKQALDNDTASAYFDFLNTNLEWEDGIKKTRKAKAINIVEYPEIQHLVLSLMDKHSPIKNMTLLGIYVNLYRDGNDWAPSHRHLGQMQFIISLGQTRALKVGTKTYDMDHGDLCIFGSASHSLLKDPSITKPRISLAVFTIPMDQ